MMAPSLPPDVGGSFEIRLARLHTRSVVVTPSDDGQGTARENALVTMGPQLANESSLAGAPLRPEGQAEATRPKSPDAETRTLRKMRENMHVRGRYSARLHTGGGSSSSKQVQCISSIAPTYHAVEGREIRGGSLCCGTALVQSWPPCWSQPGGSSDIRKAPHRPSSCASAEPVSP